MIEEGDSVAVLEGETFDDTPIRGEDSIRIVQDQQLNVSYWREAMVHTGPPLSFNGFYPECVRHSLLLPQRLMLAFRIKPIH